MDKNIEMIIDEAFKSKAQQKYFYAKVSDKSLTPKERKKWEKMASEFSDETDFKKLPEKKKKPKKKEKNEEEVEEIVDKNGMIGKSERPSNFRTKGITSDMTSDEVVGTSHGSMGSFGTMGLGNRNVSLRYWAEADMSKALGFDDTMKQDVDFDDAEEHFKDELGLDDEETKERLAQMGYDENLPDDKVRLIENPQKFIEEFLDNLLKKKNVNQEIIRKKDINPIIQKQLKSLKDSIENNDISIQDVIDFLKNEQ